MRHPKDMGTTEVEAFLTMLAAEQQVSSSTHNQSLSALVFLYKEVGHGATMGAEHPAPTAAQAHSIGAHAGEVAALLALLL